MARRLFYSSYHGVLSTISRDDSIEGYPFGSLTPYSIDKFGNPIILISELAQHTKNIDNNSKVSLTITEAKSGEVQAHGRLTIIGDAEKVKDEEADEIGEDHIRLFPEAKRYFEAHGFSFYRINFKRARFIGGFGKIFWVERDQGFLIEKPFNKESENGIIEHMNGGHKSALVKYLELYCAKKVESETENVKLVRVFQDSFDIRYNDELFNVQFRNDLTSEADARTAFKELLYPEQSA